MSKNLISQKKLSLLLITCFVFAFSHAQQTITIQYGNQLGWIQRPASGLLHPFNDSMTKPLDADMGTVYDPLNIKYIRTNNVIASAQKATNTPTYIYTIGNNVWGRPGNGTSANPNAIAPWDNWTTFENAIRNKVIEIRDAGHHPIYDFWNEADLTDNFMGYTGATYTRMYNTFRRMHNVIKATDPNAQTSGLSFANINTVALQNAMKDFISFCVTNNCVPDYWNWHFGGSNMLTQVNIIRDHCITQNVHSNIGIFEYLNANAVIYPGRNAWQMAMLEESDVKIGVRGQWGQVLDHQRGSLAGLLLNNGANKRGTWWVYRQYAQLSGKRIGYTSTTDILKAIACHVVSNNSSRILLGNKFSDNSGDTGYAGSVNIILDGISSPTNQVNVTLHEIPYNDGNTVNSLGTAIINQAYTINNNGRVVFNFNWANKRNAYQIVVTNVSQRQSIPTSNNEKKNNIEISAYPNPVEHNLLNINNVENAKIKLFNSNGQIIYNKSANNSIMQIDTKDWNKGIYFLSVTKEDIVFDSQRIIIK